MRNLTPWILAVPSLFFMAWGGNHFTPLLPLYGEHANLIPWQTNFLLGTYVMGLVPGLLIAAALSDVYGRKPVTMAGLISSALGNFIILLGPTSIAMLYTGRFFAGLAVGIGMSVGTSWIKELSSRDWDPKATIGAGARRPSLTMTLGFGVGAAVTGALAQWVPAPTIVPFIVTISMLLLTIIPTAMAPETVGTTPRQRPPQDSWVRQLRTPSAKTPDFLIKVATAAPWVFGAGGIAYGLIPLILADATGEFTTLYATMMAVLTLGVGAFVQPFAQRIDRKLKGRALPLGLGVVVIGIALAALTAYQANPILGVFTAMILGVGYGTVLVTGLYRVQVIAPAQDLAGLTGLFYALTYLGFLFPTFIAALLPVMPYHVTLLIFSGLALVSMIIAFGRIRYVRGPWGKRA
ncbi:MAG: MFS transporter [Yaniella sp.]|uniref:MFS transporter n=1 Tax=Yaniella sp. TaxID=2773929 RepID=UPI00264981AF|nr:MFS transporter [Yaniella sp.]MDN5732325.1 MFS transporter [Yaniella sp.]MDN5816198.1 MFS transporter [Yaniella sp.]MDN5889842.1 MFS transporter [Yaniella sp.]MDN5913026.1 MFS transporter [Yaniella sp.]MDN6148585.1 MFS transporter [Yaniella sp.]